MIVFKLFSDNQVNLESTLDAQPIKHHLKQWQYCLQEACCWNAKREQTIGGISFF